MLCLCVKIVNSFMLLICHVFPVYVKYNLFIRTINNLMKSWLPPRGGWGGGGIPYETDGDARRLA